MSAAKDNSPRVFVSYSGRVQDDRAFARALVTRLLDQTLDTWVYERRSTEIPVGQNIELYCRNKIDQSEFFVAVVSDASLASGWSELEVKYALEKWNQRRKESFFIIPVITTTKPTSVWPEVFVRLAGIKGIRAIIARVDSVEDCVEQICRAAAVSYVAPVDPDKRLPLMTRLMRELEKGIAASQDRDIGIVSDLRRSVQRFYEVYGKLDAIGALRRMESIILVLNDEFPDIPFYYPYIVKGVLQAELAKGEPSKLQEARRTFQNLLDNAGEEVDENLFAGLGYVDLQLGRSIEAFINYQKAYKMTGGVDPDLAYSLIVAMIVSREPFTVMRLEELLGKPAHGMSVRRPGDYARLEYLKAIAYLHLNVLEKVEQLWRDGIADDFPSEDIILEYSARIYAYGVETEQRRFAVLAIQIIESFERCRPQEVTAEMLHRLARYRFELGLVDQAVIAFAKLTSKYPCYPQYLVEEARCLLVVGKREAALERCRRALKIKWIDLADPRPDPQSFQYYIGFAHWLLGDVAEAEWNFKNSEMDRNNDYRCIAVQAEWSGSA